MNQYEMKQRAYQSNLKSRALQVLLYLIDRSNKEQTCFPAVPTIGKELHISISTVKRAMKELVEAGYVTKESRFRAGNRGQTSNLYTLYFPEQMDHYRQDEVDLREEKQENNSELSVKSQQDVAVEENVECEQENVHDYSEKKPDTRIENGKLDVASLRQRGCNLRCRNPILQCNGLTTKIYSSMWTGEEVSLIPP